MFNVLVQSTLFFLKVRVTDLGSDTDLGSIENVRNSILRINLFYSTNFFFPFFLSFASREESKGESILPPLAGRRFD